MRLENISYDENFRFLIKSYLYQLKNELIGDDANDDAIEKIKKQVFIIDNGLLQKYDEIELDFSEFIEVRKEISVEKFKEVEKILDTYSQIDRIAESAGLEDCKLQFDGFNEHEDNQSDIGTNECAEFLIKYEGRFPGFYKVFREGTSSSMEKYRKCVSFFDKREITIETIKDFLIEN